MKVDNDKALIITPYELEAKHKSRLVKALPYLKNIEIDYLQDKSLIGGFILRYGSTVFDASIKGAIDNLTDKLYEVNR